MGINPRDLWPLAMALLGVVLEQHPLELKHNNIGFILAYPLSGFSSTLDVNMYL